MSGFADGNERTGSDSSSPKYGIHPTFSGAYYNDITKPEEYYTNITILNDIMGALSKFIDVNPQYSYLRAIDISKLSVGDVISVFGIDGEHRILTIYDDVIEISFNGNPLEVDKSNIRLIDDCLNKLKRTDIAFIYEEIDKIILNDHYSCIEFFNIFSEYFKINEKTLYSSLSYRLQLQLISSLQKRLNISIIDPEKQLEKGKKVLVMRGEYTSCDDHEVHHVFAVDMYGEIIDHIKNAERHKYRLKVRIQTETNAGEQDIDIITKIDKIKLLNDGSIDLMW